MPVTPIIYGETGVQEGVNRRKVGAMGNGVRLTFRAPVRAKRKRRKLRETANPAN
jgi:hypothetical protein